MFKPDLLPLQLVIATDPGPIISPAMLTVDSVTAAVHLKAQLVTDVNPTSTDTLYAKVRV